MADVFISYSKVSQAQTKELSQQLQAKGFTVWYDTSLVAGDSFGDVIMAELAQARAAIVIWDTASIKSEWVRSEASRARARRILIPVRADGIRSHDIPPPFDSLHTELLSNHAGIDTALAKLGVTPTLPRKDRSPAHQPAADIHRWGLHYEQNIHFCMSRDSVQLAYSRMGGGPPLLKTGNWMTHLEFDFESPIWRHLYRELSSDHTLIRYDARGNGLSDRDVEDVSFETLVGDLETVVEAAGLDRFALLGISQGCAVSIAYAVRHPGRVTHLILFGGYAVGWAKRAGSAAEKEQAAAMLTLMRLGWGQENPAFRQLFTSQFIPGATKEQTDWFNELQRMSTSPEDAVRNFVANGETDVRTLLAHVNVPTLVMHSRDDARVPFDQGRRLAAGIPGARFVSLPSANHLILEHEPAFARFLQEIRGFLSS